MTMAALFPIIWLTGNMGAGKTTLARGLQEQFGHVTDTHPLSRRILILDGDEMRASISTEETLSPADRRRHNLRVARLASVLRTQGFLVLVAVIAPFASVRDEIDAICRPVWIYVKRNTPATADKPYEPPMHPHCTIDNDVLSIKDAREAAAQFLIRYCASCSPIVANVLPNSSAASGPLPVTIKPSTVTSSPVTCAS